MNRILRQPIFTIQPLEIIPGILLTNGTPRQRGIRQQAQKEANK